MDRLLEKLDNIPFENNYKNMALEQATLYKSWPMMQWLISKGAVLNETNTVT